MKLTVTSKTCYYTAIKPFSSIHEIVNLKNVYEMGTNFIHEQIYVTLGPQETT